KIIAPIDSINVIVNVVVSPYTPTKTVPINKPKLAPCFLPSCKSPPINPEKASKLISYTFNILAKDKIRPVTTPTVEPTAAPPTNDNEITIYRENTFSKAIPYIVQPINPVKTEANNIIKQIISSLFIAGCYVLCTNSGILCIKISNNTMVSSASTHKCIQSSGVIRLEIE